MEDFPIASEIGGKQLRNPIRNATIARCVRRPFQLDATDMPSNNGRHGDTTKPKSPNYVRAPFSVELQLAPIGKVKFD